MVQSRGQVVEALVWAEVVRDVGKPPVSRFFPPLVSQDISGDAESILL